MRLKHLTLRLRAMELEALVRAPTGRGAQILDVMHKLTASLYWRGAHFGRQLVAHEIAVVLQPDGTTTREVLDIECPFVGQDVVHFKPVVHSPMALGLVADCVFEGPEDERPKAGWAVTLDVSTQLTGG